MKPVAATNHLLAALPVKEREQLLANCEPVELVISQVLFEPGELIMNIYFPIDCFISLMTPINGNAGLEVGLVGNEGMLGVPVILGVDISPFFASVQGAGLALRIQTGSFRRHLERSVTLQQKLNRYLYVLMSQIAQTAACTRFHVVEARLARWLLMTQDRSHSDRFHVTHVLLAYLLGVRRVGVTKAATSLQKQKLISYHRGDITILDRSGLEAASCKCYLADKKIYEHILG
jgi:CRP-like cAMP-binding protein